MKRVGNLIIGRKTYEIIRKENQFRETGKMPVVFLSHFNIKLAKDNHKLAKTPMEAIRILKRSSYKIALIVSGGEQMPHS